MPELMPIMSLSTFLAALFIVSVAGRGIIEYIEHKNEKKRRHGRKPKSFTTIL